VRAHPSSSPEVSSAEGPATGSGRGSALVVAVPGLIACCLGLWGAGTLSFDRDEAVTVSLARRPMPGILRVLPHFDVVHGAYYLTQHFVATALGTSEIALRTPSIIGTAVAAAGTAALGRRLMSPLGGLLAGSLYAAMPIAGFYAHVARQYAIVPGAAAIVTVLFLRALERETPRAYAAYAVGMSLLGVLHLFAVLLIPVHLLALACGRPARARVRAALVACAAAMIPLIPIMLVAWTQQSLIAWAKPPNIGTVILFVLDFAGGRPAAPVLILLMVAAWVPWHRHRRTEVAEPLGPVGVRTLATVWFLVPPALLMTISQFHPVYSPRYVLVSLPGAVLLATLGALRVPWRRVGAGLLIVAIVLTIPPNVRERRASSAIDQFREAAKIVHAGERPADVVVYLPGGRRAVAEAYPRYFSGVRDIALARSATKAADLTGTEVSAVTLRHRFETIAPQRVWLVAFSRYVVCGGTHDLSPMNQAKMAILTQSFQHQNCWAVNGMTVELYLRRPAAVR
jgi:mannosyltransferase